MYVPTYNNCIHKISPWFNSDLINLTIKVKENVLKQYKKYHEDRFLLEYRQLNFK